MYVLLYYLLVNLFALVLYGADKKKAQKQLWRIPERTLLLISCFGGAFGALCGMQLFHHKTRKNIFWILNFTALAVHTILLYFLLFRR